MGVRWASVTEMGKQDDIRVSEMILELRPALGRTREGVLGRGAVRAKVLLWERTCVKRSRKNASKAG